MADCIIERDRVPDLLVSSPACRPAETDALLAHEFELPEDQIVFQPGIYEASLMTLIEIERHLPASEHIALIDNNPGLSELGLWLSPQAPDWLPSCAVLEFKLAVADWSEVTPGCATLIYHNYPKNQKEVS